jgi:hypothetical protein
MVQYSSVLTICASELNLRSELIYKTGMSVETHLLGSVNKINKWYNFVTKETLEYTQKSHDLAPSVQ